MPIQSAYTAPNSGASSDYHVIQYVNLDYVSNKTSAQVASYVSADTYTAGKQPVFTQQAEIKALPDSGVDPLTFAQGKLIAPDANTVFTAFSGGTIV